jgi:hypothetical protein
MKHCSIILFAGTVVSGVISAALCELQVTKHTLGVFQLCQCACIMTPRCYLRLAILKAGYQAASGSSIDGGEVSTHTMLR